MFARSKREIRPDPYCSVRFRSRPKCVLRKFQSPPSNSQSSIVFEKDTHTRVGRSPNGPSAAGGVPIRGVPIVKQYSATVHPLEGGTLYADALTLREKKKFKTIILYRLVMMCGRPASAALDEKVLDYKLHLFFGFFFVFLYTRVHVFVFLFYFLSLPCISVRLRTKRSFIVSSAYTRTDRDRSEKQ